MTGEKLVQRDDDKPETVRKRLQAYQSNIQPFLELYHQAGLLVEFKGRFTNEIWPSVHAFLCKHFPDAPPIRETEKLRK